MKSYTLIQAALGAALLTAAVTNAVAAEPMVYEGTAGGVRFLEEGQPPVIIHPTVEGARQERAANRLSPAKAGTSGGNLNYHGGTGGIGVETAPHIYLVLWGSQWNNNDPSGEAALLQSFF